MKNSRVATLVVVAGVVWWGCSGQNTAPATAPGPEKGGRLVATFRTEPKTYNRFVSPRSAEDLFMRLTQATLIRAQPRDRRVGAVARDELDELVG